MYDEPAPHTSTNHESEDASVPERCSYCGRPLGDGEGTLLLMRDGRAVAAYHERCNPHHRRSGCSAC